MDYVPVPTVTSRRASFLQELKGRWKDLLIFALLVVAAGQTVYILCITMFPGTSVFKDTLQLALTTTTTTTTTTLPPDVSLTYQQRFHRQEQEMRELMKCQPVPHAVSVIHALHPHDSLLDQYLISEKVSVPRCPTNFSLCVGRKRCMPTSTTNKSIVVAYEGDDERIHYEGRNVEEHTACGCRLI